MTESSERRITSDELYRIVLTCRTCDAEILVDLENERQTPRLNSNVATACPICDVPLDSAVTLALRDFFRWYRALREAGRSIGFRLPMPPAAGDRSAPNA